MEAAAAKAELIGGPLGRALADFLSNLPQREKSL
jgi:hypothetical protein